MEKWNVALNCIQIEIWHNVVLFMPQTKSAKSATTPTNLGVNAVVYHKFGSIQFSPHCVMLYRQQQH